MCKGVAHAQSARRHARTHQSSKTPGESGREGGGVGGWWRRLPARPPRALLLTPRQEWVRERLRLERHDVDVDGTSLSTSGSSSLSATFETGHAQLGGATCTDSPEILAGAAVFGAALFALGAIGALRAAKSALAAALGAAAAACAAAAVFCSRNAAARARECRARALHN